MACVPTAGVRSLPRILQAYLARHPHNRIEILEHSSSAVALRYCTDGTAPDQRQRGIEIGSLEDVAKPTLTGRHELRMNP